MDCSSAMLELAQQLIGHLPCSKQITLITEDAVSFRLHEHAQVRGSLDGSFKLLPEDGLLSYFRSVK